MFVKHGLVHITAGINFRHDDYIKIADELNFLHGKEVVWVMAVSIEAGQPKDAIQVAILFVGGDLLKDRDSSCESEEECLDELLPIPHFLIKKK
jgi:hypothetical protein